MSDKEHEEWLPAYDHKSALILIKELQEQVTEIPTICRGYERRIAELQAKLDEKPQALIDIGADDINEHLIKRAEAAEAKVKQLQEQVEKYKAEIRESCEDMRSEYRTCDLAHELGEQVKELEADYGLFVEIVSSQEEQLAIIEGSEQLATEQALAAEAKVKELEAKLEQFKTMYIPACKNEVRRRINEILDAQQEQKP